MIKEFKLTDAEYNNALAFEKEHQHKDVNKGAVGGHISVTFVITSIGNGVDIKCGICGEKKDITDYDSW